MQPPYTEQAYGQYPSTPSHNSGSGYPSHPGVTDFMTPVFAQRAPSYTQDIYSDQPAIRTGPGYGNDALGGGSISGYSSCHAMPGSWGTPPAPQPLQNSDYSMSSVPYGTLRQGEPYYARYHFGTEQVPSPTMSFLSHLPKADLDQDASSEWRSHTCRVGHAEEDEIFLTYGNDSYGGGSITGYAPNHAMAGGSWETPASQPLQNSDCSMPSIPYSNPGEPYYPFGAEQVPGPTTSFSPHLPEAGPNQDASSEWRFRTCWVSHAEVDEIHLTIALNKSRLVVC